MIVDLHMHTTCSDGVYTPEQLTQMAVDAGLSVMAISDHDTVAAYDGSHRFAAGVRVIPAIEISSECDGEDVHILGYGIDTADAGLQAYCAQFKERRFNRALEIVDRCRSLGYDINRSGIEATLRQGGTVGRPHIARLLVAKGYFPDVKTVFDKLLYRGGPATSLITAAASTTAWPSSARPAVRPSWPIRACSSGRWTRSWPMTLTASKSIIPRTAAAIKNS